MAYLTLKNFKYGLDLRKSELTSQLGVLNVLQNGHINQGGEIEDKQAFNIMLNGSPSLFDFLSVDVSQFGITIITNDALDVPSTNPFFIDANHQYQVFVALLPDPLLPPDQPQNIHVANVIASCPFAGGVFCLVRATDTKVYGFYFALVGNTLQCTWVASDGTYTEAGSGSYQQTSVVNSVPVTSTFYFGSPGSGHGVATLANINTATTCFNFKSRVYIATNPLLYFCALGDPTQWGTGSGFGNIKVTNWDFTAQPLLAAAPYQNFLSLFSQDTAQTWSVPSDPTTFSQVQIFRNTGTVAPGSVYPLGDLDVMFCNASGIRSLRVRDSSLNAYVNDFGSPVDSAVQLSLAGIPIGKDGVVAITEPLSNRYWCYINGTLYVLSYFPSVKIVAWSTYAVNILANNGTYQPVIPIKFFIYKNIVWFLGFYAISGFYPATGIYSIFAYGNPGNINPFVGQFNTEPLIFETPWLDANKPGTRKMSRGFDAVFNGIWTFYGATDYNQDPQVNPAGTGIVWKPLATVGVPTPNGLFYGMTGVCTHVKFRGVSTDVGKGVFSSLIWHYQELNEKP